MTTPRDDNSGHRDTPQQGQSQPDTPETTNPPAIGFHYGFVDDSGDSDDRHQHDGKSAGQADDADPADRPAGADRPRTTQPVGNRSSAARRESSRGIGNPGDDRVWNRPGLLGGRNKNNSSRPPKAPAGGGWRDREEQNGAAPDGGAAPGRVPGKQSPAPVKAMPAGWPVGSFTSYAEAQAAVDMLSDDGDFPVKDISIIGVDLMEVEKVVGRLSWGKVLGRGALSGAWMGLFIGLLISMFQTELVAPLVAGLAMGVVFGLVTAGVPYAMSRGTRDFATTTEIIANRYDVICAPDSARRARDLISRHRHNRR